MAGHLGMIAGFAFDRVLVGRHNGGPFPHDTASCGLRRE